MKHLVLALALFLTLTCPLVAQTEEPKQTKKPSEFSSAQDYIEYFRRGEEYYGTRLPGLLIDNRPDPKALEALGEELATGTREVRENIIRLLGKLRHFPPPRL